MTSCGLGAEGFIYGCSETVNKVFCFCIFISAFYMVKNILGLSICEGLSRSVMTPLMICKLIHHPVTVSLKAVFFSIILKLKELYK